MEQLRPARLPAADLTGFLPAVTRLVSSLSPSERILLLAILAVVLLGTVVRTCRSRVEVQERPREVLPTVEAPAQSEEAPD